MEIEEKLRVIAECLRTLQGGEWSVREVLDLARVAGVCVREQTAYSVLYNLDLPGRRAAGKRRHGKHFGESASHAPGSISENNQIASEDAASQASGSISQARREAFHRNGSNASGSDSGSISGSNSLARPGSQGSFFLASLGFPPTDPSDPPVESVIYKRVRAKKPEDTAWVPVLEDEARAISRTPFMALTADERFCVGRFLALRFANCTKNERKNRRAGAAFAKGLADMAIAPHYRDLTLGQYVGLAKKLAEKIDGPFYNAWDIKSVVEWE